jgi:hypothetical protein
MVNRWRRIARAAAFAGLALLLSACLKLDMDIEVSADNTVSGTVILAVQTSLLELGGGSIEDVLGSDSPLPPGLEGVTQEPYEDEEFTGQRFTFESIPLEQFNQNEEEDALRIIREGDVFRVTGVLDLAAGASGATGLSGVDPEQFLQGAELRIVIAFPGEVTDTNGEADGNIVTWQPEVGERLELRATASAIDSGGGSSTVLLLIVGGAVVVAVIVLLVVISRRRGRPAVATVGGGEAPTAVVAPPSSTPPPAAPPPPPPPPPADRP